VEKPHGRSSVRRGNRRQQHCENHRGRKADDPDPTQLPDQNLSASGPIVSTRVQCWKLAMTARQARIHRFATRL
jgi:hypothetical protein